MSMYDKCSFSAPISPSRRRHGRRQVMLMALDHCFHRPAARRRFSTISPDDISRLLLRHISVSREAVKIRHSPLDARATSLCGGVIIYVDYTAGIMPDDEILAEPRGRVCRRRCLCRRYRFVAASPRSQFWSLSARLRDFGARA